MDSLYLLAVLACPIGMGLMMWFMGRGNKSGGNPPTSSDQDREIAQLRGEVDSLCRQQARDAASAG